MRKQIRNLSRAVGAVGTRGGRVVTSRVAEPQPALRILVASSAVPATPPTLLVPPPCPHMCCGWSPFRRPPQRRYSSDAANTSNTSDVPTLKTKLKKFYMRVHPDLYDSHDEARELNTKSLGMLTSVTDSLATADASQGAVSSPSALAFFIKPEYIQSEVNPTEENNGLARIAVTIQSDEGFPHSPRYLRSLHRSLSSLFQQSGLEPEFVWGDVLEGVKGDRDEFTSVEYEYEEGTLQGYIERMRRLAFLRMERARVLSQRVQLLNILLNANGIRTLFPHGDPLSDSDEHQLRCLTEIRRLFGLAPPESFFDPSVFQGDMKRTQKRPHSKESETSSSSSPVGRDEEHPPLLSLQMREILEGRLFVFSSLESKCRVDGLGRILMSASMRAEDLAEELESDGGKISETARERSACAQETGRRERLLSEKIGIDNLFSDPEIRSETSYLKFLEELENHEEIKSYLREDPDKRSVPIRIQSGNRRPKVSLHKEMGILSMSVDCTPEKVLQLLKQRGDEARFLHQKYVQEHKNKESNEMDTKRTLKLQGLRIGRGANDVQMKDCCQRLLWLPKRDIDVFDGLKIIICDNYEVLNNGEVRIPWNWK